MRQMQICEDLAAKYSEAQSHGSHWLAKQRANSNKDRRLHDELNHVEIEPLVDMLVPMKAQLRELEHTRHSFISLQRIPSFYKPRFWGILSRKISI